MPQPSRKRNPSNRLLGAALLATFLAAGEGAADDTALFTAAQAPNVMVFVDTSYSMREIMYHPEFDSAESECAIFNRIAPNGGGAVESGTGNKTDQNSKNIPYNCDPNTNHCRFQLDQGTSGFVETGTVSCPGGGTKKNGYVPAKFCGRERKLYVDGHSACVGGNTWHSEIYVEWFFSEDADEYWIGNESNTSTEESKFDANQNGIHFFDGNRFPLFKQTRLTATKATIRDFIYETNGLCGQGNGPTCTSYADNVRFGLAEFKGRDGGYVMAEIDDYSQNKDELEDALEKMRPDDSTPLSEALFKIYTFFMSRDAADRPVGDDDDYTFPKYAYKLSNGDHTGDNALIPGLPMECSGGSTDCPCQKNFVIMMTDGEPTNDRFDGTGDLHQGFSDFDELIGDYNDDSEDEEDLLSNGSRYLDDIALFMSTRDFRPDIDGLQTIDVYTVGFHIDPASIGGGILKKAAEQGNGDAFFGRQSSQIKDALIDALSDIIEKAQSFTAATVPASRATDGNNFFASYFLPSDTSPYWQGHLKLFEFNALGEIRDAPVGAATQGECALEDPLAPARCLAGRLKVELDGFWDSSDEIPAPASRDLFVSRNAGSRPATIPSTPQDFDTTLSTTDLDFGGLGLSIADLSDYDKAGDTTGITSDTELKDAIVRYIQGCEFEDGATCVDRGDGEKLWDIFHSNPVVVGPPNLGLSEPSYREFVSRYKHRKRVIYAGSNGGFVHGFNAGEYDTATVPDAYDRGTGEEEFGFMAWPARKKIADLPRTISPKMYLMDGTPVASDVWLYQNAEQNPDDVASNAWNRWRTVIIGGMRQGGDAYWALDVTNPPDHNSASGEQPTGPSYPGYMWEFPCESSDAACTGVGVAATGKTYADYMGETWGDPVITRVRMRTDCVDDCDDEIYDRWVAIFTGGYHPTGDPNHASYDFSYTDATSRKGRAIFMVDIATGKVLAMRRFHHEPSNGNIDMRFAFAASPAVFDLNYDGYADVAYFADLGGGLWKWVITDDVIDPVANTTDGDPSQEWSADDGGWKFLRIFQAGSCGPIEGCTGASGAPGPHLRSFFFPPAGALVGSKLYLVFGSGERNDLDFMSTLAAEKNRLYVMYDADPLEREVSLPAFASPRFTDAGASTDFVNASTLSGACTPPPVTAVGFYVEGEHGEKFVTNAEIFFGLVLAGSYVPAASPDPCNSAGDAYLHGVNLFCAAGGLPDPSGGGGKVSRVSVGDGMPNRPRVSVGPVGDGGGGGGDCADMVVVITSDGEAFSDCPGGRPDSGVSVKTWRDD